MSRMAVGTSAAVLLLLAAGPRNERFTKYRAIQAYEVRPGILMMPRYADDGQVCEIGVQRLLYTPEKITLDPTLSRTLIDQIVDELAPVSQRGQRTEKAGAGDLILQSGNSVVTNTEYENVSIRIYSDAPQSSDRDETVVEDLVATITWKHRKCQ
jgi:hypothetical protein